MTTWDDHRLQLTPREPCFRLPCLRYFMTVKLGHVNLDIAKFGSDARLKLGQWIAYQSGAWDMPYKYESSWKQVVQDTPNQFNTCSIFVEPSLIMPSRVFFITGTSSGFGRELVKKCLAEGDKVVATARKTSSLSFEGATEANYRAVACDVTDMKYTVQS